MGWTELILSLITSKPDLGWMYRVWGVHSKYFKAGSLEPSIRWLMLNRKPKSLVWLVGKYVSNYLHASQLASAEFRLNAENEDELCAW